MGVSLCIYLSEFCHGHLIFLNSLVRNSSLGLLKYWFFKIVVELSQYFVFDGFSE